MPAILNNQNFVDLGCRARRFHGLLQEIRLLIGWRNSVRDSAKDVLIQLIGEAWACTRGS